MTSKEITIPETHAMRTFDPFREFRALSGLSEVFDDLLWGFPTLRLPEMTRAFTPKVNIQEKEKEYVITTALPGIKKEDVKISVQDGVLTLSGEFKEEKEEKGKTFLKQELACGAFQRSFILPAGTHPEDIHAFHKDGILMLTLPKPAQEKPRGVNIKIS